MSTQAMSLFFTFLALTSLLGAAGFLILSGANRTSQGKDLSPTVTDLIRLALPLAWAVATVSTLGSLYYSEIAKFKPCPLCWYQRIAMYPLVLLLGIATVRRDRSIRGYVAAQAGVGAAIALYHSFIQAFPPEGGSSFCTVEAPCTERYVWELGFVSIPFMALSGFLFIISLMVFTGLGERSSTPTPLTPAEGDSSEETCPT